VLEASNLHDAPNTLLTDVEEQRRCLFERLSVDTGNSQEMGYFRPLGLEGRVPGCERFGSSWAVPENAVKPKKQKPGVKKIERTEHPA
jgi:hypothetical protein